MTPWKKAPPAPDGTPVPGAAKVRSWAAWVILLASLSLTVLGWYISTTGVERTARMHFDSQAEEIRAAIDNRIATYEQVLRGAVCFFAASSGAVAREQWETYVNGLKLQHNYPGILGIGFSRHVPSGEKHAHIRKIRAEHFPAYTIWPEGARDEYAPVVYFEPFRWRNPRVFGYDMYSEPVRHAALERARDSGRAAISGKITRSEEIGEDIGAGFLMVFPVYQPGAPLDTVEQKRRALLGYFYSAIRMDDLMAGLLGRRQPDIHLEIFDGIQTVLEARLWNSGPAGEPMHLPTFARTMAIELNGRTWTLKFSSLPSFEAGIDWHRPTLVLSSGALISLLLFGIAWSLSATRARALALAVEMSSASRENEERLRLLIEGARDYAIFMLDPKGHTASWNAGAERITGYRAEDILGRHFSVFLSPEEAAPDTMARCLELALRGGRCEKEGWHVRADGSRFLGDTVITALRDDSGNLRGFVQMTRDITERWRAEQALRENERFRALFEYAQEALFLMEEDGRIVDANRLACESLGYDREELIGALPDKFVKNSTLPLTPETLHRLLERAQANETIVAEAEYRRKDGSFFPVEAVFSSVIHEGRQLLLLSARDISERKQAEEILRQTLAQLEGANRELQRISQQDGLTGIANRRYFDESLALEWQRGLRSGQMLSLIIADVDHFKDYNDHYGHQAGDECLKKIAAALNGQLSRPADLVARYGGEEFVVLLPDTSPNGARHMAERMRAAVESLAIPHEKSEVAPHVTLSLGTATIKPVPGTPPESLIAAADKALYQAKSLGRNRVFLSEKIG
jgi:diguanylate cyclase (GGDEF)-like protein/PAS domain S-box-containing protein